MVSNDDWRRNGQEKYLTDAELIFMNEFQKTSDKWEHEHCEFCLEKFSSAESDLHSGYCTPDFKRWICPDCFEDFKEEFRWTVADTAFLSQNLDKRSVKMPEISLFYGIKITMYSDDHNPPHFHAEYAGKKAMIDIQEGVVIRGGLPNRQLSFVLAWCNLHKDELMQNWELSKSGKPLNRINPLV